jgi:hypothetical protein
MNAARLTRRWQEATGDPARMAEALADEIDGPATAGSRAGRINAARLTRRWQEAAGDPVRMVEALVDELGRPSTIAPDLQHARDVSTRLEPEPGVGRTLQPRKAATAGPDPWRKVWIGLGVQIVIVTVMTVVLFQVLR